MTMRLQFYLKVICLLSLTYILGCTSPTLRSNTRSQEYDPRRDIYSNMGDSKTHDSDYGVMDQSSEDKTFVSIERHGELESGRGFSSMNRPIFEPQVRRSYQGRSRLTKEDFIDSSAEEGSLWASNGQTNYFFTKNKVRNPGELISLVLENDLYKEVGQEMKRSLSFQEQSAELNVLGSVLRQRALEDLKLKSPSSESKAENKEAVKPVTNLAPAGQNTKTDTKPETSVQRVDLTLDVSREIQEALKKTQNSEEIDHLLSRLSIKDVNIFPSLELQPGETLNGQILERYQNGNYKIRAFKKVFYKNGKSRFLKIVGTIKGSDITEDTDLINSGKLYEYKVEVSQ